MEPAKNPSAKSHPFIIYNGVYSIYKYNRGNIMKKAYAAPALVRYGTLTELTNYRYRKWRRRKIRIKSYIHRRPPYGSG